MEDARERFHVLAQSLQDIPRQIGGVPEAVLVISGHWEADEFTVMASSHPPMVYDYSGFPEHTYHVKYAAPGSPRLAQRVQALIEAAGMPARLDPKRGFDHGTFTPLVIMYPKADVPVLQVSLPGLDPARLAALGEALAPLRDEGVLVVASGSATHNLREFRANARDGETASWALAFGEWLADTLGIVFAFRWTGAALACGVMSFPLLVRPIRLSIEAVDRKLEQAASTLGAAPWRVFLTVTLPLALPGILAGMVLGFAKAIGEFGATITFVSNIPGETQTISSAIYSLIQTPDGDAAAMRLVLISIVIATAALIASEWFARRATQRLHGN